jgi:hypothetical protein
MDQWSEEEVKLAIQKIISEVNSNEEFKKLWLENSGEAIKQVIEKEISEDLLLEFIKRETARILALTDFENFEGELSNSNLEQVAGGTIIMSPAQNKAERDAQLVAAMCAPGGTIYNILHSVAAVSGSIIVGSQNSN